MTKKIAFLPLRAGSKEIPEKNVKLLAGKPLFCWILDTIIESSVFDEIWIATDCINVKDIVNHKYPSVSIFNRSPQNALDTSPTVDVVLEFLDNRSYGENDWLIQFQATSPFTSISEINRLIDFILKTDKYSIVACYLSKNFRWNNDGFPLDYTWNNKPRRQDYGGHIIEAGAFYASKISKIKDSRLLVTTPAEIIEICETSALDINSIIDFAVAETYIRYGLLQRIP